MYPNFSIKKIPVLYTTFLIARIVFKLMIIVHKSFNNIAPIYISELLKVYTPSRNLCSSNMSFLNEHIRAYLIETSSCNLQFFSELITTQLRISHGVTANSRYLPYALHHAKLQVLITK